MHPPTELGVDPNANPVRFTKKRGTRGRKRSAVRKMRGRTKKDCGSRRALSGGGARAACEGVDGGSVEGWVQSPGRPLLKPSLGGWRGASKVRVNGCVSLCRQLLRHYIVEIALTWQQSASRCLPLPCARKENYLLRLKKARARFAPCAPSCVRPFRADGPHRHHH